MNERFQKETCSEEGHSERIRRKSDFGDSNVDE